MGDLTRVVLACSGPSLMQVDVREPGLPVIAVSTAIRNPMLHEPNVWVLADSLNPNHGPGRNAVWENPKVLKIVPEWTRGKGGQNVRRVDYCRTRSADLALIAKGRDWMDGKFPIMRDSHKSVTLALSWLATEGAKTILIAGCDLKAGRQHERKYGYEHKQNPRNMTHLCTSLNHTHRSLQRFYDSARRHGITLLSWSPGSRLEEFMETYGEPTTDPPPEERSRVPAPL